MSKKSKQVIYYILTLIFVVAAPILFLRYFILNTDDVFYERAREDNEICYQRAKRDSVDTRWCDEIKSGATLAYIENVRNIKFIVFHTSLSLRFFSY